MAVSSVVVHYVSDYAALAGNVSRWLRPGGAFVYSMEHPMTTARKAAVPLVCGRSDRGGAVRDADCRAGRPGIGFEAGVRPSITSDVTL